MSRACDCWIVADMYSSTTSPKAVDGIKKKVICDMPPVRRKSVCCRTHDKALASVSAELELESMDGNLFLHRSCREGLSSAVMLLLPAAFVDNCTSVDLFSCLNVARCASRASIYLSRRTPNELDLTAHMRIAVLRPAVDPHKL